MKTSWTGTLLPLCILVATPLAASAQGFGRAVAVSQGELIVGEPQFSTAPGTVFLYSNSGGTWEESGRIMSPDAADGDGFGFGIAVSGDRMLVTALNPRGGEVSRLYTFTRGADGWSARGALEPNAVPEGLILGLSSAVSGDVAAVGAANPREGTGLVFVFRNVGGAWTQEAVLESPVSEGPSGFGSTLAFMGEQLVVGAPLVNGNAGTAYLFEAGDEGWSLSGELTSAEGEGALLGVSALAVGDRILVGAAGANNRAGAVFAFERQDGSWAEAGRLVPFDGDPSGQFGAALASDGRSVWVGAPGASRRQGRIYHFEPGADGGWGSATKLAAPDPEPGAGLGAALSFGDGILLSGLPGDDYGAGTALVFREDGEEWVGTASVFTEVAGMDPVLGGQVDCANGEASLFDCSDVDLVSFVPVADLGGSRGVRVNDVWGWTDPETRKDYAIVGRTDGTSFVDVTNPSLPVLVGNLPKTDWVPGSTWRDMKVYRDHVFVVSDGAEDHGMQVFDLTRLRQFEGTPLTFDEDAHYDRINSAHNIVINEETGFAYAVGSSRGGETCGGGLHMIDIRDPKSPTFAGCFADPETGRRGTGYSHDAQCVVYRGPDVDHEGREICFGANETALSIADVTDKDNPVALAMASYPNVGYSHQGWLTEDHTYFYMNDELDEVGGNVESTRTLVWDVTDLDDPVLVKEHFSENRSSDHNLYIRGNLMYQSNYLSGLRVLDISDAENPEEVAFFDTVPFGEDEPGMSGSWSNYPFFDSGVILVTSGREGLFLVKKRERTPVS